MSDYLLLLLVVAAACVWWFASSSIAGSVARTPETEQALEEVTRRVAVSIKRFELGEYEVIPIWAHGCPCVRVSIKGELIEARAATTSSARVAAEQALEAAIRETPAFAHIATKYRGEQGLHWY